MNKLKKLIRRWLGVEQTDEKIEVVREYAYKMDLFHQKRVDVAEHRICRLEDVIGKTIRAGFDHHVRQPSWIVLAWRDKHGHEHVHFYETDKQYISQINDMLKSFKRENVIIDTHPQIAPYFKW